MVKLCIVDLDGVVADSSARFAKAEEARQTFLNNYEARLDALLSGKDNSKEATALYWQTAFDPTNVALDTRIEGVDDALLTLDELGYKVVFLTSRPEAMREATLEWLLGNSVYGSQHSLIMKAPGFQFVKTVTWKAGMVQTLAALYGAREVLFVDDEAANREALMGQGDFVLTLAASLAETLEEIQ